MADDNAPSWPSEWLRGVLTVCVLAVLAEGPTYGYAITVRLAQLGVGQVKGGTLYPLLGRLEADGLVDVAWQAGESGPGRKYFALNEAGHREFAARSEQWLAFTRMTLDVVQHHAAR